MHSKYSIKGLIEAEYEPGSKVLRNKLGIRTKRELEKAEAEAFRRTQAHYWKSFSDDPAPEITENLIREIHHTWLGELYEWAGEYRQLKMSKKECIFAFPLQITSEMKKFQNQILNKLTPVKKGSDLRELAEVIARVHGEFEIIHPFREGNGRVGRLICDLIALQAGYPPLNFERLKVPYMKAMQKVCTEDDFVPLATIIKRAITAGVRKAKT